MPLPSEVDYYEDDDTRSGTSERSKSTSRSHSRETSEEDDPGPTDEWKP